MIKFVLIVGVLQTMAIVYGGLLPPVLPPLLPVDLLIQLINGSQAISIGPLNNTVGTIALPLNTLCSTPLVNAYIQCAICNEDCYWVHNSLGGNCAANPRNASQFTCLCSYNATDAQNRAINGRSSQQTCGLLPLPLFGVPYDNAFKTFLEIRMDALLCNETITTEGCSTDCQYNHGDNVGGGCAKTLPLDPAAGNTTCQHCECNVPKK